MANSKRQCCGCKKRFKTETMIETPIGNFHSKECRFDYATRNPNDLKNKTNKRLDDEFRVKKREYNRNKLSTRKRATKEVCHEYIRLRDKGKLCPCCLEPLGDDFQAGHFLESGNNPKIRYDEDNIHGQRKHCNIFKGGDSGDYEINLRVRIGDKRVDRIKRLKGGTVKMTADDYREIETFYKNKITMLEYNLN